MKDPLDYKEPIIKIYLVRHGRTKANVLKLLFGQLDWDLIQEGIKDAKGVANKLSKLVKNEKIDCIISSPLKRTRHTAKIISKKLKIKKIIFDKNLMERSEGKWSGKTFWIVRDEDPKNYYRWIKNPIKSRPPEGESIIDLNKRVKKFYKKVLKKYIDKNIIVVAHSGSIKAFILNVLNLNLKSYWKINVNCGSITEIHLSKKQKVLWAMNLT